MNSLFRAFAISLFIHLLIFGGWKWGKPLTSWPRNPLSRRSEKKVFPTPLAKKNPALPEVPLTFVEVDQSALEPPKETKFYGAANTKAANPEKKVESNIPKISGSQDKVPKVIESAKSAAPLQPSPPEHPTPTQTMEVPPKKSEAPGDLAFAKPENKIKTEPDKSFIKPEEKTARARPRKLSEVKGSLGEKIHQEGGVANVAVDAAFDVKITSFGSYDAEFIEAVKQRWYALLAERNGTLPGRVALEFRLHSDGRITNMKVMENNVGEMLGLICQKAILDPSPFRRWPQEMRREINADFRDVTFSFYYLN
ncbi:MAG: hypothetical protein M3Y82_07870 [Verrucomicrobiota bacterium]|nr:hypothetical protein [Verrucomicrobiota bacterium]